MNKSKSLFRKCAFCPHHNQKTKCCCKKSPKPIQNAKKSKSKNHPLINQSSIPYQNESQMNFEQVNFSNIIAQNSMLKRENNNLKNDLLSISHCINQERMACNKNYMSVGTCHTLKTESQQLLSDRLYISNKKLQEAILQLDILSAKNKELSDKNSILSCEISSVGLEKEQLKQEIRLLKKQIKRENQSNNQAQLNSLKNNYKTLRQKYENTKIENSNLNQQLEKLRSEIEKKSTLSDQNMSPEWIAQTSNKLTFIQQKIDCAQTRLKHNSLQNPHNTFAGQNFPEQTQPSPYFQLMHQIKKEIALSINTIHSKTRKFNSVFDTIGSVDNINIKSLVCSLIQGFVESCINLNSNIEKELNRKINVLEKRLENLLGKLENFVLDVKNRQMRKRSTSRSRILLSNKSGPKSRSPNAFNQNKQNMNRINISDKSY